MSWFRLYDELLDDPKAQRLSGETFKGWVNLLCLAKRCDGALPASKDIAFALRTSESAVKKLLQTLIENGLLDVTDAGFEPHNWQGRQYQSDSSADRVNKYRNKRRASGLPVMSDYSKFRESLVERDGARCVYCLSEENLVVDHMVPISLGGTDDEDNLALACKGCNSGKAGRTPELAAMQITVTSAANALSRYRDSLRTVTVTVTPPEQSRAETDTETEQKEQAAPKRAARKTQLQTESLTDDWQAYCHEKRPELEPQTVFENFRDFYLGHGRAMQDWTRTWQRWVRNEKPNGKTQHRNGQAAIPENRLERSNRRIREALAECEAAESHAGLVGADDGPLRLVMDR